MMRLLSWTGLNIALLLVLPAILNAAAETEGVADGTIRIAPHVDFDESFGVVEVFHDGQWGYWCEDPYLYYVGSAYWQTDVYEGVTAKFNEEHATFICNAAGYSYCRYYWAREDNTTNIALSYGFSCFLDYERNSMDNLNDCFNMEWGVRHGCHGHVIGVDCYTLPDNFHFPNLHNHVEGGTRHPEVTTLDECMQLCLDQEDCYAIDWNGEIVPFRGTRCWFHYGYHPYSDVVHTNYNVSYIKRLSHWPQDPQAIVPDLVDFNYEYIISSL